LLVGGFNPSEKYLSVGIIIPNIWKNKTCSKPPTRLSTTILIMGMEHLMQTFCQGELFFTFRAGPILMCLAIACCAFHIVVIYVDIARIPQLLLLRFQIPLPSLFLFSKGPSLHDAWLNSLIFA